MAGGVVGVGETAGGGSDGGPGVTVLGMGPTGPGPAPAAVLSDLARTTAPLHPTVSRMAPVLSRSTHRRPPPTRVGRRAAPRSPPPC